MNVTSTTQDANLHRVNGWLLSLILHGLLFSAALPLFRQLPITLPAEPFRWDVTLVPSTQRTEEPIQAVEATGQMSASSTEPVPITPEVNRPNQTVASSAESIAAIAPIQKTTAVVEPQPNSPPSIAAPAETAPVLPEPVSAPRAATAEPAPAIPASEEQPATALRTSDPPVEQTVPTAPPMTQEASEPAAVATSPGNNNAPASDPAQPMPTATATPLQADAVSVTRADYGWLQRAIFQRLEELKRSSRPSLDQSRPLKVLVKAVVSSEGVLMEAEVVKSSGLDRIDQEAMALVQRAFPMRLDRTLDHRQIVMRIPISYSRD